MFSKAPLNILFFGSDEFSMHSLKALESLRKTSSLIGKLQLVTRPPKWCGRHKSILKRSPIVEASHVLGLPLPLSCETNQDWIQLSEIVRNESYNMIIAVSFGKLIPKELLTLAKYSLNVHPSLLPRYKGASPIQYSLLNRDEFTGVTIQTLDPFRFDFGSIVSQTEPLRVDELLSKGTVSQFDSEVPPKTAILMDQLGLQGGSLLKKVIVERLFERKLSNILNYEPSYAPKITANMRHIDWSKESAESLLNKLQAIGSLHTYKCAKFKRNLEASKRVIFHKFRIVPVDATTFQEIAAPGEFTYNEDDESIYVRCKGSHYIQLQELQLEGYKIESAKQFITSLRKRCGVPLSESSRFSNEKFIPNNTNTYE